MSQNLTQKQKAFINKYLKQSNATEAAMEAYNCNDRVTAASIGWENLRKPHIKQAVDQALQASGLTPEFVTEELKKAMVAGTGVKASNSDTLRAIDIYARLIGGYEPQVVEQSYRVKLHKMGQKELTLELEKRQKISSQLLRDLALR